MVDVGAGRKCAIGDDEVAKRRRPMPDDGENAILNPKIKCAKRGKKGAEWLYGG